jgi:hypothetical protein
LLVEEAEVFHAEGAVGTADVTVIHGWGGIGVSLSLGDGNGFSPITELTPPNCGGKGKPQSWRKINFHKWLEVDDLRWGGVQFRRHLG